LKFLINVFEEVDTQGGNHDEMKPAGGDYQVYFSLHIHTVKTNPCCFCFLLMK